METETIRSARNPRVVEALRLHRSRVRARTGLTLIEGPHLLAEAVGARAEVIRVFGLPHDAGSARLAAEAGAEWLPVDGRVLERIAATETPRGPVAVLGIPPPVPPSGDSLWADVSDPGNAGTMIRTAGAFGLGVVLGGRAVDPWSPKTLRSAAGAHFHTTIDVGDPPPATEWIATVPRHGTPVEEAIDRLDPRRRWTVLVGSEAHGLDPSLAAQAAVRVTIPMPGGLESLNAAVAGAIVMYLVSARRRASGRPSAHH